MKLIDAQEISTVDLYFICQMIDKVVNDPTPYLRNIEDIFGDMASVSLTRAFPKWTCLHQFIEAVIESVVWEQANERMEVIENGLWVDHLFSANGLDISYEDFLDQVGPNSPDAYLQQISEDGSLAKLSEMIAKQVFYVLFGNRKTLHKFGEMVRYYVTDAAPCFKPESYTAKGRLHRKQPPVWAQSAVFHRDRGMCVKCNIDLTRLINRQAKLHFDHIIPLHLGGMNCITNLQLLCEKCNLGKGGRESYTSHGYENWYNYE